MQFTGKAVQKKGARPDTFHVIRHHKPEHTAEEKEAADAHLKRWRDVPGFDDPRPALRVSTDRALELLEVPLEDAPSN